MLNNKSTQDTTTAPADSPEPGSAIWHLVDGHPVYGVPPRPWWRTTADVLDDDRDMLVDELSLWWLR